MKHLIANATKLGSAATLLGASALGVIALPATDAGRTESEAVTSFVFSGSGQIVDYLSRPNGDIVIADIDMDGDGIADDTVTNSTRGFDQTIRCTYSQSIGVTYTVDQSGDLTYIVPDKPCCW